VPFLIDVAFDPVLIMVGPFQLSWASVFTTLGLLVTLRFGWRALRSGGLPPEKLGGLFAGIAVGGVIAGRLLQLTDHLAFYRARPEAIFALDDGGFSLVGYWIGGVVAAGLVTHLQRMPAWRVLDLLVQPALAGQAIGWLGPLCTGANWGLPTGGAWGVAYWNPRDLLPPQLLGVPTQPYPLYQSAVAVLILASLCLFRHRIRPREGATFLVAFAAFFGSQLLLAFFRAEPVWWQGLSLAQIVALSSVVVVFGVGTGRIRPLRVFANRISAGAINAS
jgi:prolipoprotein diacylglyceryltransferase